MEVIPSVHTSPEVVQKTVDLMKDLGKAPIVEKKELNGFVLNRLQYAIIMEAWRLVEVIVVFQLIAIGTALSIIYMTGYRIIRNFRGTKFSRKASK